MPERRYSDKVIRLAEHRQPANDKGLSPGERVAFREIGERLKKIEAKTDSRMPVRQPPMRRLRPRRPLNGRHCARRRRSDAGRRAGRGRVEDAVAPVVEEVAPEAGEVADDFEGAIAGESVDEQASDAVDNASTEVSAVETTAAPAPFADIDNEPAELAAYAEAGSGGDGRRGSYCRGNRTREFGQEPVGSVVTVDNSDASKRTATVESVADANRLPRQSSQWTQKLQRPAATSWMKQRRPLPIRMQKPPASLPRRCQTPGRSERSTRLRLFQPSMPNRTTTPRR